MTTPPDGAQQSFTAQDIDAWLRATAERRATLHIQAARGLGRGGCGAGEKRALLLPIRRDWSAGSHLG